MENQTNTQNNAHFVTYAYSKDFHGKAPDYAVDHGEGIGYDLQQECMIYTTSLEEAEHDILEYAKKYTNKEKPLFGFHVFERPGNAYIITTKEGAVERTSERWYSPDGTLVAKSDTSTVSSDPEEKRMFKGWESTNFKKGDIVEFYTPKRHYVALGIVISDVCPPDVAEMLHDRHGNRRGYDADMQARSPGARTRRWSRSGGSCRIGRGLIPLPRRTRRRGGGRRGMAQAPSRAAA